MHYPNTTRPGGGEPRADASPEVSGDLSMRVEDHPTDYVGEGKPSVLSLRPRLGEMLRDPRRWVSTPGHLPVQTAAEHRPFWVQKLLQIGTVGGGSIDSGSMLWDKLGITIPHQLTEGVLNLKNVDDETARAAHSALIGTFNSSLDENDLEAAAYALSVFLNTHPLFSHMAAAEEFNGPFGHDVAYELVNLPLGEA